MAESFTWKKLIKQYEDVVKEDKNNKNKEFQNTIGPLLEDTNLNSVWTDEDKNTSIKKYLSAIFKCKDNETGRNKYVIFYESIDIAKKNEKSRLTNRKELFKQCFGISYDAKTENVAKTFNDMEGKASKLAKKYKGRWTSISKRKGEFLKSFLATVEYKRGVVKRTLANLIRVDTAYDAKQLYKDIEQSTIDE